MSTATGPTSCFAFASGEPVAVIGRRARRVLAGVILLDGPRGLRRGRAAGGDIGGDLRGCSAARRGAGAGHDRRSGRQAPLPRCGPRLCRSSVGTAALLDDPRPGDRGGRRADAALRVDPPRPHPAHRVGGRAGHRSGRGGGRGRPRYRRGSVPGAPGPSRARSARALPGGRLSRRARSVPDPGGAGHQRAGRDRVPGRGWADEDRHGAPRGRHRIAGRADREGAQAQGRRALPRVAHA